MNLKLEYLGEDGFPGAKIWGVEAIHVTTTRNRRRYTEKELVAAGRSLSFRPLNINHDPRRALPFPENSTLFMEFDKKSMSVKGRFRVIDRRINEQIEKGDINAVSIEQFPTGGETCNQVACEQHGIAFTGMALVEANVLPGDEKAINIKRSETYTISDLKISDEQRTCKECTDFEMCHTCKHSEADCMEKCLTAKKAKGVKIDDQAIAICLSECGKSDKKEAWKAYKKAESFKD